VNQVLLVEDDPIVRTAYAKVLKAGGLSLETAQDGVEALEKVRAGAFDAVVTDINMPRLSGIEFLRRLRENRLDVPVVLVTGGPALETAVRAVEYGAFRYLSKPVDVDALIETVTRAARVGAMAKARLGGPAVEPLRVADMDARDPHLAAQLDGAIDALWVAFQPIVSWGARRAFGFEALVRSDFPALPRPGDMLLAAEKLGRLRELGRAIRARVAEAAPLAPEGALLFVNLHASDLEDEDLHDPRAPLSRVSDRVVLEITERAALDEVKDAKGRIAGLRALGFRLAVDDLGAGYAGLASFATIEPDVVKLDMSLVRGVDGNPMKQTVVRSVSGLSRELGMRVIAEGIETPAERDTMIALGCDLLQGYLFAKPGRGFPPPAF
jgi:EAL domain-containing protein (putative c-di-GMP-specific phosphodiesterase class I)/CheY-like chemotaxis protein